jgi:hypothetical protein
VPLKTNNLQISGVGKWGKEAAKEARVLRSVLPVISDFRGDADEICALLRPWAASSGNPLPTFRDNVSVPSSRVKKSRKNTCFLDFLAAEDGIDTFSPNIGKGLPLDAA